jgi:hypothetical protein
MKPGAILVLCLRSALHNSIVIPGNPVKRLCRESARFHGCHAEHSEASRIFQGVTKTRFFGGVYPERVEGPQNDIVAQP